MPSIDIAQWEEEYTQQKIQASKGRRGRKDDKSGKSQSKTDEKKSKAKKEEEEEPKPEEVEETLEDKLVGYMNFPVGPINIDCEKDVETIQSEIVEEFKNANPVLFEKCANGVEVFVKDKQLKNPKQILHHGHILKEIVVRPKVLQIIPPAEVNENSNPEGEGPLHFK